MLLDDKMQIGKTCIAFWQQYQAYYKNKSRFNHIFVKKLTCVSFFVISLHAEPIDDSTNSVALIELLER